MKYISTRSQGSEPAAFSDILLEGLAADGGLYVPQNYPQLTDEDLTALRGAYTSGGYASLAAAVTKLFVEDIPAEDIDRICHAAYSQSAFGSSNVVSTTRLGATSLWIGHISHGPTAAFKDMAMQLLGELFDYELRRRNEKLTILGATSGDTGSAAEYALRGRDRIAVVMLTPAGRMTPFQRAQMFGLEDPNIINVALDGVFDDCQEVVKSVNADARFKAAYNIGAVNSINWARLMAQVVYYIALWIQVAPTNSDTVSFAVPSGNFGNICAGHIARCMGVPIDKLILATNENDVLNEFFRTGIYRVRAGSEVEKTSSPSMDIAKASNFERFIFDLLGRDAERVAQLFASQLSERSEFSLREAPEFEQCAQRYGFISGSSTHKDRIEQIRFVWEEYGVLIDPHTADGVRVARDVAESISSPIIALETALPVKFAQTIEEAIGCVPECPERFAGVENGVTRVLNLPNSVEAVKSVIESYYSHTA